MLSAFTVKFIFSCLWLDKEEKHYKDTDERAILLCYNGIQCFFFKIKIISNIFTQVFEILAWFVVCMCVCFVTQKCYNHMQKKDTGKVFDNWF